MMRLLVMFTVIVSFFLTPVAGAATGDTWTARNAAEQNNWGAVTYGNGLFVAVAFTGTNQVMTSPDGVTWTAQATPGSGVAWRDITYGAGLFVAITANNGNQQVMTSPDAKTWTLRSTPGDAGADWTSVAYGAGRFVAVSWISADTNQVMTSVDGITWQLGTVPGGSGEKGWRSVTFGGGQFVAVQSENGAVVMTSPDGITWTKRTGVAGNWEGITYGAGKFVAVGQKSPNAMVSVDGINWVAGVAPDAYWVTVAYGSGRFVALTLLDTRGPRVWVMTSPDGATWTGQRTLDPAAAPNNGGWRGVAYENDVFVAVAQSGTNRVMTSGALVIPPEPVPPVVMKPVVVADARPASKRLRPYRKTKVVRSVETTGTIRKVRVKCLLEGTVLRGAAKKRACAYNTKNLGNTAVVKVKAKCSVRHRIKVKIVARNTAGKTVWVRGWGVKNKPRVHCAVAGNG